MIGRTIGPYQVVAKLGEGGMGEVYRATDSHLKRSVALKVLPAAVAADAERLARFQREAEVLAALNHPNIAAIYGLEKTSDCTALVMELVEGEDLSEIIARHGRSAPAAAGPSESASRGTAARGGGAPRAMSIEDALPIATQIAEALEAAHEQGIIHRDLKPANIKVRPDGTVKVLDFGLAKALVADPSSATASALANSPTLTSPAMTAMGMILGTAAYMAPEQARGRPVDKRADIWAFGVVLYEMLSGRRAFEGDDISETLASVLKDDVRWDALPADLPLSLHRLVRRCLERDPKKRLRDIGEARLMLGDPAGLASAAATASSAIAPPAAVPGQLWQRALPWAIAALLGVVATWLWAPWVVTPPAPVLRLSIVPEGNDGIGSATDRVVAMSPMGTHIAYVKGSAASATSSGTLVVRALDQPDAPSSGVDAARAPFFSWDGKWVGFFAGGENGELKKVSIAGGAAVSICAVKGFPRGASWGPDNTIVFTTTNSTGLLSVPAAGGEPRSLTTPATGTDHYQPSVLPDGRVLFTIFDQQRENNAIAVFDLRSEQQTVLIKGGSQAEYVELTGGGRGGPGYLIFGAAGALRAVRFDPKTLEVKGDVFPVVDRVATGSQSGATEYAVSRTGALLYLPGAVDVGEAGKRTLVWVDRNGQEEPVNAPAREYSTLRLSPDGTRVALESRDQDIDIWVWSFAGRTLSRLTWDKGADFYPVWTPDGQRIVSASRQRGAVGNLFWQAADGTGVAERLTEADQQHVADAFTPDGKTLVFEEYASLSLLSMIDRQITPLLKPPYEVRNAALSPDGQFVAYESLESRPPQIFVHTFPDVSGGRWQVSTAGGARPVWAPSGRELFYLSGPGSIADVYAVPVTPGTGPKPSLTFGTPTKLFTIWGNALTTRGRPYDVSRDGKRFLAIKAPPAAAGPQTPFVFVVNWIEELAAKVAGK